jgi:type I restriction enzyme S subunit
MTWRSAKLSEVADIERDGIASDAIETGTRYLGLEHIEAGGKILGAATVDAGDLASTKFRFTSRHVLYGKLRPYLAKIATPDFDGICSTDIVPIMPGPRLDRSFLTHFLRQPSMIEFANSRTTGANLPRLSPKALADFEIPLPPLEEQKRIAAILDQADDLRRKRQRALDRLNQLGQAIFIEMFGDPATNPKGFDTKSLGEIIEFIGGSQPAKSHFLYEPGPDRVRFIQIRDFRTDKYPTYVPKALAKRPFSEEDVMIGRYGPPVFQIFRGLSGTYNVALMKAKPRRNLTSDFVFYLLQEPKLHGYVVANSERTAGQSGVNLELLEKYPAYEPPPRLLSAFSERIGTLNAQLLAVRSAAEQTDALFASLQQRAFCALTASSLKEAAA